jgi:hypothetical protein
MLSIGTPVGDIVFYSTEITDCIQFAIDNDYKIIMRPYSNQPNLYEYQNAYDAGILVVMAHYDNANIEVNTPPYLMQSVILVGGGLTHNIQSYGQGLEFFDAELVTFPGGSYYDQSESGNTGYVAGNLAKMLDLGYNHIEARQALRQICSFYPDWTKENGYGKADFNLLPLVSLDSIPPFEISVAQIRLNTIRISFKTDENFNNIVIYLNGVELTQFLPGNAPYFYDFVNNGIYEGDIIFNVVKNNIITGDSYNATYTYKTINTHYIPVLEIAGGLM